MKIVDLEAPVPNGEFQEPVHPGKRETAQKRDSELAIHRLSIAEDIGTAGEKNVQPTGDEGGDNLGDEEAGVDRAQALEPARGP